MLRAVPNRNGRLSKGTLVEASILARLLGIKLLKVDASILVVPAQAEPALPPPAHDARRQVPRGRSSNGGMRGEGLDAALRSLDEGAAILAETRRARR